MTEGRNCLPLYIRATGNSHFQKGFDGFLVFDSSQTLKGFHLILLGIASATA